MGTLDTLLTMADDKPYQDYIVLAGQRSPGLAVVRGSDSPRKWDVRNGYGFSGATIVYTGLGLALGRSTSSRSRVGTSPTGERSQSAC